MSFGGSRLCLYLILVLFIQFQQAVGNGGISASEGDVEGWDESEKDDVPATVETSAFGPSFYQSSSKQDMPCVPEHIHLSLGDDEDNGKTTSMTVSFSLSCSTEKTVTPVVLYGQGLRRAEQRPHRVTRYHVTDSRDLTQNYTSPMIYHVQLSHLEFGQKKYWYRILVFEEPSISKTSPTAFEEEEQQEQSKVYRKNRFLRKSYGKFESIKEQDRLSYGSQEHFSTWRTTSRKVFSQSPTLSFFTPPFRGSPVTLALAGDVGQTYNSTLTALHIYKASTAASAKESAEGASMVLVAGDLSYADSDQTRWTNWLKLMEPLFSRVPLQVAAGNHEVECDGINGEVFTAYENWFDMPNRIQDAVIRPVNVSSHAKKGWCSTPSSWLAPQYDYGNAYYAFTHGMVRMIVLSSYSDTSVGSIQYNWLEQELQKFHLMMQSHKSGSSPSWLIVVFHCPLYTTFSSHNNETQVLRMKENMEPLFTEYGVNLVVTGHDHAYMRTHPIAVTRPTSGNRDSANENKKTGPVFITIGAGGNREGHVQYLDPEESEDFVAKRDRFEYGFGLLEVKNVTHAKWKWVRDGTTVEGIRDDVWLHNHFHL